jgi:uncharacterized membrane protein
VTVVVTLVIATLVGVMSLGVDVGLLYLNEVGLQKAADAAVLAAATFLPASPTTANTTACQYAETNGVLAGEIKSVAVTDSNTQVSMTITKSRG